MTFDWKDQPESAGPMTEPGFSDGRPALDLQALAQRTIRLPQLDPSSDDCVPVRGDDPYRDPERMARDRDAAGLRGPDPDAGLRHLIEASARQAGADQLLARRVADNAVKFLPKAVAE